MSSKYSVISVLARLVSCTDVRWHVYTSWYGVMRVSFTAGGLPVCDVRCTRRGMDKALVAMSCYRDALPAPTTQANNDNECTPPMGIMPVVVGELLID